MIAYSSNAEIDSIDGAKLDIWVKVFIIAKSTVTIGLILPGMES